MPEHLVGEEARLRSLEKQRAAGELKRPSKSAVFRSTEHVAQRLTQPQKEIDVGAELRKANTQAELCRIQRRMADLQRRAEDNSDVKAGLGPKLLNVNKWVAAQADEQRENLVAGKTKDGKEKGKAPSSSAPSYSWTSTGGTAGGNPDFMSTSSPPVSGADVVASSSAPAHQDQDVLMVECRTCGVVLPWESLQEGDGCCGECRLADVTQKPSEEDTGQEGQTPEGTPAAASSAVCQPGEAAPCTDVALETKEQPSKSTWRSRRRQQRAAVDV